MQRLKNSIELPAVPAVLPSNQVINDGMKFLKNDGVCRWLNPLQYTSLAVQLSNAPAAKH